MRIGFTARGCDVTTIESNQSSNRKYIVTGAAILAVAVGAYGLGRVYPPLGPVEGTIAPAQRHVNPQIASGDVTLGDTSIPQLMQTDAFEVMSKNPSFRALAADPNFAALAQNSQVMAVIAANPKAYASLAGNPQAFLARLAATATVHRFEITRPSLHDIFVEIARPSNEDSAVPIP